MPSPLKTCIACGYSLRGITSTLCPECGAPTDWYKLTFFDLVEFRRAGEALSAAGIAHQHVDAGLGQAGVQGLIAGGGVQIHELRIGVGDRERADEVLQREGISPQLPVIDRSEHACPECGAELRAVPDPVCPSCRTAFRSIDVGDPGDGPAADDGTAPAVERRPSRPWARRILVVFWIAFGTAFLSPFLWSFMAGASFTERYVVSVGLWLALSAAYLITSCRDGGRREAEAR